MSPVGFGSPTFWLLEAARLAWHTTSAHIAPWMPCMPLPLSPPLPVCIYSDVACDAHPSLCVCLSPSLCIFPKLQGQAPIWRNLWPPMPGMPLSLCLPLLIQLCLSLTDCTCTKLPHHACPLFWLCVSTVHFAHLPPMPTCASKI